MGVGSEVLTAVCVVLLDMHAQDELSQLIAGVDVGEDKQQLVLVICTVVHASRQTLQKRCLHTICATQADFKLSSNGDFNAEWW